MDGISHNMGNALSEDAYASSVFKKLKLPSSQTTLGRSIGCVGVALHSGQRTSLVLKPAKANEGIIFRRVDLDGAPEIRANWDNVVDTRMCTTLGNADGVRISTIEHLMAALAGCHIDNVIVEVDGSELPVMDGSAQPFVFLIECAGSKKLGVSRSVIEILKTIRVGSEGRNASLMKSDRFSVGFEIEFDDQFVARQEIDITLANGTFKKEIARARTFGFAHEVEALRASGLALGGNLDNAIVVDGDHVLNSGGLRYSDEFVRHKVLDVLGDLYLSGAPILGRYQGVRAGHRLTNELLRMLFADSDAWRIISLNNDETRMEDQDGSLGNDQVTPLLANI